MIRRIHTFAGLLALVPLLIFAITGLSGAMHPPPMSSPVTTSVPFAPMPGDTDRRTAERVVDLLGLSLATPVQQAAIQHDDAGHLLLDFYHANGRHRVTVLPSESRLEIVTQRTTVSRYLDILHMTTAAFRSDDWRMKAWSYANEAALWCVFLLLASGAWMLVTRPVRGTHHVTAMLFLPVAILYAATALQMAHRTWFPGPGILAWAGRLHRGSAVLSGILGIGVVAVVVTGLQLWWVRRPDRPAGIMAAAAAAVLMLALIVAMR